MPSVSAAQATMVSQGKAHTPAPCIDSPSQGLKSSTSFSTVRRVEIGSASQKLTSATALCLGCTSDSHALCLGCASNHGFTGQGTYTCLVCRQPLTEIFNQLLQLSEEWKSVALLNN
ncbi:hypothetical protein B0T25DRAFT_54230 [Lasiosphaeria hispida]|uniref:Uncharacterized protein n=1 Tax=Lasiosphaeria hispida TaxID=260671 RepID=A0AAJ0HVY8_9PEZI|nr:hypothetical protein B0T25DRAFT_54230 [Lasiosphaeria hispida]